MLSREEQIKVREELKKKTWHVTDPQGREFDFAFAQLCAYFGIKYICMYKRVVQRGMTVEDALEECRARASTWGYTYENKRLAKGVWDNKMAGGK